MEEKRRNRLSRIYFARQTGVRSRRGILENWETFSLDGQDLYDRQEQEDDNPWHQVTLDTFILGGIFSQIQRKINQFAEWCFVLARPDR